MRVAPAGTSTRSLLTETIRERAAAFHAGDLKGYDVLTDRIDTLLEQLTAEAHPLLPADSDGHQSPRAVR